jgi:hypothetical protein
MTTEHHQPEDRYIQLGVGHPSGDPARHRVFEVRASYSAEAGGWVARLGEQNANDQLPGFGARLTDGHLVRVFDTPAACLGDAVTTIVAMVDAEAAEP